MASGDPGSSAWAIHRPATARPPGLPPAPALLASGGRRAADTEILDGELGRR